MNKDINGAGYHDHDDVNPVSESFTKSQMQDEYLSGFKKGYFFRKEEEEMKDTAAQVKSWKRKEATPYKGMFITAMVILGVLTLLYAMQGDQQALSNGYIH